MRRRKKSTTTSASDKGMDEDKNKGYVTTRHGSHLTKTSAGVAESEDEGIKNLNITNNFFSSSLHHLISLKIYCCWLFDVFLIYDINFSYPLPSKRTLCHILAPPYFPQSGNFHPTIYWHFVPTK